MLQTLQWTGSSLRLLDQTKLPTETTYVDITDEQQTWDAIKRLVVRGAPAIGIAAAFGVYLGLRGADFDSLADFDARLDEICAYLATSRPTAVNLFWALDRQKRVSHETRKQGSRTEAQMTQKITQRLLAEALTMIDEDNQTCRAIGEHGLTLLQHLLPPRHSELPLTRHSERSEESQPLDHQPPTFAQGREPDSASPGGLRSNPTSPPPITILTHCNAGGLATAQYGTALAPIYLAHQRGLPVHVYADETRPLLQGSRITAFELLANGIPTTLICDNMAATVMSQGKIHAVLVGADRIAANGDVANKIGTLAVAILAKHYNIPFYVAAPTSSIDLSLPTGSQIPIEQRDPTEITHPFARQTAPDHTPVYNPAFDITPAPLITAIITEHGIAHPPYTPSLQSLPKP